MAELARARSQESRQFGLHWSALDKLVESIGLEGGVDQVEGVEEEKRILCLRDIVVPELESQIHPLTARTCIAWESSEL